MLVGALTIGAVFFIFIIPLGYWLAAVFSRLTSKAWNGSSPVKEAANRAKNKGAQ